jgi:hypothetical protein
MWDQKQSERFAFEEALVKKYFPGFSLSYDHNGNPYFAGWTGTRGRRNNYKLRLELSEFFPDSEPDLFVESPRKLLMYDGVKTINSLGTSHSYHVYENEDNGFVQICHTNDWDSSCTCVMALLRGALWVDGYEHHLRTGETIHQYLKKIEEQLGD